ncbi:NIF-domain-containing protein [Aureobasidium pullulans]|uniref:Mitochondrial import inner membrane translocase subunit TIM50 n=1 Tax=Aureobasidium pullulans TaxID=5580 RepID=A0A4T0BHX9_AURPU|nr:NIF-domain-containing protein [Aureobasidium pullulans]
MLSRAAQRAAKAPIAHFTTSARSLAKPSRFVPAGAAVPKTAKQAPAATPRQPPTTSARQTSPGTSIPKDKTWKPTDSIKFAAPAAAAAASQAPKPTSEPVRPAADGPVSPDGSASTRAAPSANTEPTSQPGPFPKTSSPEQASEASNPAFSGPQSAESNTTPTEQPTESQPSGPLPDLRQGIPSTFDFEFMKKEASAQNPTEQKVTGEEIPESNAEATGSGGRRGGEGEDEQYRREDYETSFDKRRARMANYGYLSLLAFAAAGTAYFTRPYGADETPQGLEPEHITGWAPQSMYARVKNRMSSQAAYYTEPTFDKLLPEVPESQRPPFTLVLSLEDLLIHSSWSREHGWRTAKRPGVDYFLKYLSQYYELVLFTSVPVAMADPVIKKLDPFHIIQWPLFREATKYENGEYVKDLNYLNRPLDKVIMIDTKAAHVKNNPNNAIVLPKWEGKPSDPHAKDLVALIPFLEYVATMGVEDTRKVLESFAGSDIPTEFAAREGKAREAFQKQLADEQSRRPQRSIGGLLNKALGIKAQPGGLSLDNETTVAEGLSQGKMLSDQIRERGQREYQRLEAEIQKNGEKWLKEMEEEEKKFMENMSKDMKKSWFGWGSASGAPAASETAKRQE